MSDGDEFLPNRWIRARLTDVCEIRAGIGFPPSLQGRTSGDVPFAKVSDVSAACVALGGMIGEAANYVSLADVEALHATIIPSGATLFAKIGEAIRLNRRALTRRTFVIDNNTMALVPQEQVVDPQYLFRFMGTVDLYELAQATTVPSLRKADLELLEIPLPPLAEQRRIVAKLDELLASSRAARAALDAVPALLEQYRQAVLAAAFRGDLTTDWRGDQTEQLSEDVAWVLRAYANEHEAMPSLPSSWRYVPVESVAEPGTVVTYGIILPGPDVPDGVPYVRQQDIEDGRVRLDALGRTSHAIAAKHARSALREGDVLLCIIRHLRVAVVPPGIDGANITQGAVRIRPAPFITADYLATYLSSPAPQEWMKRCYIGMAMPRINVKDARAVPVAVPPLPEQHEIMRRVADVLSTVERQLAAVREMQRALDDLEKATLAKAFCGELVPQDPADESASALLARLRAERASATGDRPRRRAPVRA